MSLMDHKNTIGCVTVFVLLFFIVYASVAESNHGKLSDVTPARSNDPIQHMRSVFIPKVDIFNPSPGVNIFKPFPKTCYHSTSLIGKTVENRATYRSMSSFYKEVSIDGSILSTLAGLFTMGTTLGIKSDSISQGMTEIIGTSLNIYTYVRRLSLDANCFKSSESELTDEVMDLFDDLPLSIENPWLEQSWQKYDTFLKKFGSHFIETVYMGAAVRQWTFAKYSTSYTDEALRVKACLDFSRFFNLKFCDGITKEEINKYSKIVTSNHMEILGGSDKTRNAFRSNRTNELLEKLLNEGREMQSPVGYKYVSIWDILMMKFYNDAKRYAIAMNLMQYYMGFKDFGCTLQENGVVKLRSFQYRDGKPNVTRPTFQCMLVNKGCHSDSDCHIGGAGTVTYCYGSSCYDYRSPSLGKKAADVVARTSKSGSYNEGLNLCCHYEAGFRSGCTFNYFKPISIWNGEENYSKRL